MNLKLENNIKTITGIGPALAGKLSKLGINTVSDLLLYFPFRYADLSKISSISEIQAHQIVTIIGTLKNIKANRSFKTRVSWTEAIISDQSGSIKAVWFNQSYIANSLKSGDLIALSGKVERYKILQLQNPVYEKLERSNIHTARIVPIYRATAGLSPRNLRTLMNKVLPASSQFPNLIPEHILTAHNLLDKESALKKIHFPDSMSDINLAQKTFAFEELLIQQSALALHKQILDNSPTFSATTNLDLLKAFIATLKFQLTSSQKRAAWDIIQDLSKNKPMNRLLQGDVGSGKTMVAILAMLQIIANNGQAILLAPTEILASQHYKNIYSYLAPFGFKIAILTSKIKELNNEVLSKQQAEKAIRDGTSQIIIGTHALLNPKIKYKNKALVVLDEQHRFGVKQRSSLNIGENGLRPHLLSMSATPIPRTLALLFYSDLSVSAIKQRPQGRPDIITKVVTNNDRSEVYKTIKQEITKGHQAFIVTPRLEDSNDDVKSAKAEFENLKSKIFSGSTLGLIHGKMKSADKDQVMKDFADKQIDILVATSVIEVGIDVPNATVMVIENANRFGLAQLHQLRGRVGRGSQLSYCFVFGEEAKTNNERLSQFAINLDGFKLAEMDLKDRGMGSLIGTEQSGYSFSFPQSLSIELLEIAKKEAQILVETGSLNKYSDLNNIVESLVKGLHLE